MWRHDPLGELEEGEAELSRAKSKKAVLAIIENDGRLLELASASMKDDKQVVLTAVRNAGPLHFGGCHPLVCASDELRTDREVLIAAVKHCGGALRYVPHELRSDKAIVLAAVQQDGRSLEDASPEMQADKEVVLTAVKQHGFALMHASPKLDEDNEVVLAAVQQDINVLRLAEWSQSTAYKWAATNVATSREELEGMRRDELQLLAKAAGIKANMKKSEIISRLWEFRASSSQAPRPKRARR